MYKIFWNQVTKSSGKMEDHMNLKYTHSLYYFYVSMKWQTSFFHQFKKFRNRHWTTSSWDIHQTSKFQINRFVCCMNQSWIFNSTKYPFKLKHSLHPAQTNQKTQEAKTITVNGNHNEIFLLWLTTPVF